MFSAIGMKVREMTFAAWLYVAYVLKIDLNRAHRFLWRL